MRIDRARYIVTPAKGQSDQQMNNDQFRLQSPGAKADRHNPDRH